MTNLAIGLYEKDTSSARELGDKNVLKLAAAKKARGAVVPSTPREVLANYPVQHPEVSLEDATKYFNHALKENDSGAGAAGWGE